MKSVISFIKSFRIINSKIIDQYAMLRITIGLKIKLKYQEKKTRNINQSTCVLYLSFLVGANTFKFENE